MIMYDGPSLKGDFSENKLNTQITFDKNAIVYDLLENGSFCRINAASLILAIFLSNLQDAWFYKQIQAKIWTGRYIETQIDENRHIFFRQLFRYASNDGQALCHQRNWQTTLIR